MASLAHCHARVYRTYFFYNGWITKKNMKSVPIYGRKNSTIQDMNVRGDYRAPCTMSSPVPYFCPCSRSPTATWFHGSCIPVPVPVEHGMETLLRVQASGERKERKSRQVISCSSHTASCNRQVNWTSRLGFSYSSRKWPAPLLQFQYRTRHQIRVLVLE